MTRPDESEPRRAATYMMLAADLQSRSLYWDIIDPLDDADAITSSDPGSSMQCLLNTSTSLA